jgi:hypothetical protein
VSLVSGGVSSRVLQEAAKSIQITSKKVVGFVSGWQTAMINMYSPPGATSRVEIADSRGNIQPKTLIAVLDDELSAEIHVVLDGSEVPLVTNINPPMMLIDVEGTYGVFDTPKIIFVISAPYGTTKPNWGILEYYGAVVQSG